MGYPLSPFPVDFDVKMLLGSAFDVPTKHDDNVIQTQIYFKNVLKWLCTSPTITTFRVNTLTHNVPEIQTLLLTEITELSRRLHRLVPLITVHPLMPEVILLHNWNPNCIDLERKDCEVIVDVDCASAVLRGAHIFGPGVMGMVAGTRINDAVSIYADLSGMCKKGLQKKYECPRRFYIGNGIAKMNRHMLFGENSALTCKGIAVEVTGTLSGCPSLTDGLLPKGSAILQNLPSIVCSYSLNPQAGDVILDMCAAPGNKTTHIAALINNKGTLIAIDKTPAKVNRLKNRCEDFLANVLIFQADSTRLVQESNGNKDIDVTKGPPFAKETFDRILLDAPCSALGKRPQLANRISEKALKSYVPLQRKLFGNAVQLLKVGGRLVYSTCTITMAENEGIVAWALRSFPCLELIKSELHLGEAGLPGTGLDGAQRTSVQRFGHQQSLDSVGFFLAVFVKRSESG